MLLRRLATLVYPVRLKPCRSAKSFSVEYRHISVRLHLEKVNLIYSRSARFATDMLLCEVQRWLPTDQISSAAAVSWRPFVIGLFGLFRLFPVDTCSVASTMLDLSTRASFPENRTWSLCRSSFTVPPLLDILLRPERSAWPPQFRFLSIKR